MGYTSEFTGRQIDKMLPKMVEITYSDLAALVSDSQLIVGQKYRITDYETMVATSDDYMVDWKYPFDVVVTAKDKNTFFSKAEAIGKDNNTNADYASWQLWYSFTGINNCVWKPVVHKGTIYRMIDKWNNDCSFDFYNIKFNVNGNYYTALPELTSGYCRDNVIKSYKTNGSRKYFYLPNIVVSSAAMYPTSYEFRCLGNYFGPDCHNIYITGIELQNCAFRKSSGIEISKALTYAQSMTNAVFENSNTIYLNTGADLDHITITACSNITCGHIYYSTLIGCSNINISNGYGIQYSTLLNVADFTCSNSLVKSCCKNLTGVTLVDSETSTSGSIQNYEIDGITGEFTIERNRAYKTFVTTDKEGNTVEYTADDTLKQGVPIVESVDSLPNDAKLGSLAVVAVNLTEETSFRNLIQPTSNDVNGSTGEVNTSALSRVQNIEVKIPTEIVSGSYVMIGLCGATLSNLIMISCEDYGTGQILAVNAQINTEDISQAKALIEYTDSGYVVDADWLSTIKDVLSQTEWYYISDNDYNITSEEYDILDSFLSCKHTQIIGDVYIKKGSWVKVLTNEIQTLESKIQALTQSKQNVVTFESLSTSTIFKLYPNIRYDGRCISTALKIRLFGFMDSTVYHEYYIELRCDTIVSNVNFSDGDGNDVTVNVKWVDDKIPEFDMDHIFAITIFRSTGYGYYAKAEKYLQ